jgi:hypothetical protein
LSWFMECRNGKRVLSLPLCEEGFLVGQDYFRFFKFLDPYWDIIENFTTFSLTTCGTHALNRTTQSLPVTSHTTRFNIQKFCMVITVRLCFVWITEQTGTFALYVINRLDYITEMESVYSAVRTESLYNTDTSHP